MVGRAAPAPGATRVLFVCTGNICRSPLAEAIFTHYVREEGLEERFVIDSAGLDGWHEGEPADPRTCDVGEVHGIPVPSIARRFQARDFERFDVIVAMDRGHLSALRSRAPEGSRQKVHLMRDYDHPENHGRDVPDPYYGGPEGFERMYQMLAVCCRNLLDALNGGRSSAGSHRS
jgi:protein-tyrosine phosphatase